MSTSSSRSGWVSADDDARRDRLYRQVAWRIVPLLFVCYLIAMIDRSSVGYAKLQFLTDLGFSEAAYGLGAGLFFIGYVVFEVPSNIYLHKVGVRRTILRIMVLWGLATVLAYLVRTPFQFYAARFLLGAAEGGFFPGVLLYMTYWFPADKRARVYAMFMLANPLSGLVGGLVAGWIMGRLDGTFGLHGWQMLFIAVGTPAIILGIVAYLYLSDTPASATWLSPADRAYLLDDVARSRPEKTPSKSGALRRVLASSRIYVTAAAYFTLVSTVTVLSLWGPSIIRSFGIKDVGTVGYVSAVPYAVGFVGMYVMGYSSDRMMERRWHYIVCALSGAAGAMLLATVHGDVVLSMLFLAMIAFGVYGGYAVFFTIPAAYLEPELAPTGLAVITALGSLGGFVTPSLIGWIKAETGSLDYGLAMAACISFAGALIVCFGIPRRALQERAAVRIAADVAPAPVTAA